MNSLAKLILISLSIALIIISINSDLVNCEKSTKKVDTSDKSKSNSGFSSPCGTKEVVSKRIGLCMDFFFDLVEGKVPDASSDKDILAICTKFSEAERCVRTVSKDCLKGIHKTATSAVATATRRYRTQECASEKSRSKYYEPLKCCNRKSEEMKALTRNITGIAQAIRDSKLEPEQKLMKICCLLNHLDKEMEIRFNKDCPESTGSILAITHAMTDDARATLCRAPKCDNFLKGYTNSKYKPGQNFLMPVMSIIMDISTE